MSVDRRLKAQKDFLCVLGDEGPMESHGEQTEIHSFLEMIICTSQTTIKNILTISAAMRQKRERIFHYPGQIPCKRIRNRGRQACR